MSGTRIRQCECGEVFCALELSSTSTFDWMDPNTMMPQPNLFAARTSVRTRSFETVRLLSSPSADSIKARE